MSRRQRVTKSLVINQELKTDLRSRNCNGSMQSGSYQSPLSCRKSANLKTSKESHMIHKSCNIGTSSKTNNNMRQLPKLQYQLDHHQLMTPPPSVRVVHIFNPTVFKTEAANFRSLVQELTGNNYSKFRRSCRSFNSHKKGSISTELPEPKHLPQVPALEAKALNHEVPRELCHQSSEMLGCLSFKDPFFHLPFFQSSSSDDRSQPFDVGNVAEGTMSDLNAACQDAIKSICQKVLASLRSYMNWI